MTRNREFLRIDGSRDSRCRAIHRRRGAASRLMLVAVAILVVVALLIRFFPEPVEKPVEKPIEEVLGSLSGLSYSPPPSNLRLDDYKPFDIPRWLDRLDWATTDVQNWTKRHLKSRGDEAARAILRRLPNALERRHFYAKKLLDALSLVAAAVRAEDLESALSHSMDFVRIAALKVLVNIGSPRAIEKLAEISGSGDRAIAKSAEAALLADTKTDESFVSDFLQAQADAAEKGLELSDELVNALVAVSQNELASTRPALEQLIESAPDPYKPEIARALLALGDPEGLGLRSLETQLGDESMMEKAASVVMYHGVLPRQDVLDALAEDRSPERRIMAAEIIAAASAKRGLDQARRNGALSVLDTLERDSERKVSISAKKAFYFSGRKDVAKEFLNQLRTARGGELRGVVHVLSELLEDDRGRVALRERLEDPGLEPIERAHLLHGLSVYGDAEAKDVFIDAIRKAGTDDDPLVESSHLSLTAAVKIQSLGDSILPDLLDLIADPSETDEARLLSLEAIRSSMKETRGELEGRILDVLKTVVVDDDASVSLRRAALESMVYFDDVSLADVILDLRERLEDAELRAVCESLIWNYF